eukprot:2078855-Pyramimonas_sp.AAC.1
MRRARAGGPFRAQCSALWRVSSLPVLYKTQGAAIFQAFPYISHWAHGSNFLDDALGIDMQLWR